MPPTWFDVQKVIRKHNNWNPDQPIQIKFVTATNLENTMPGNHIALHYIALTHHL